MAERDDYREFIEGEYEILEGRDYQDPYDQYDYRFRNGYFETDPYPPYMTYMLLGLNIVTYLIMTVTGMLFGLNQTEQLFIFGAKFNLYIAGGQYWRLLTAMFLHIGIMHLFFNSYALYAYGPIVEKLYGKLRFVLVYIVSGLTGSLFSYVFSPYPAAGASGAIFGLMGSLLYFRRRRRDIYQRVFGPRLLMIIAINLFYGFVQPGIDNWGHIGGLVGGYLVGNATGLYKERGFGLRKLLIWLLLIAVFASGLYYGRIKYKVSIPNVL